MYNKAKDAKAKQVDLFEDFFKVNRQPQAMTSDRLCKLVLQIIVISNLSFHQAKNLKLQELLALTFPSCDPPNEKLVAQCLKSEAQLMRGNLRDQVEAIDSRMSLALDIWHLKVGNMEFLCKATYHNLWPKLGFTP